MQVWFPQPETLTGLFPRQCRHKPESGSRIAPAQRRAHDPSALQPERERRSARGSGKNARCDGCQTGVGKLKNGLATGYGQIQERAKPFRMWWPGTELNRRRQPFQGCALPPELPGHVRSPPSGLRVAICEEGPLRSEMGGNTGRATKRIQFGSARGTKLIIAFLQRSNSPIVLSVLIQICVASKSRVVQEARRSGNWISTVPFCGASGRV